MNLLLAEIELILQYLPTGQTCAEIGQLNKLKIKLKAAQLKLIDAQLFQNQVNIGHKSLGAFHGRL